VSLRKKLQAPLQKTSVIARIPIAIGRVKPACPPQADKSGRQAIFKEYREK